MPYHIAVRGKEETQAALMKISTSVQGAQGLRRRIGPSLIYGFGIETGRHKGGRNARAAGGAHYMEKGAREIQSRAKSVIVQGVREGKVIEAFDTLAFDVERVAKQEVPVVSHSLQRSIHVERSSGGLR